MEYLLFEIILKVLELNNFDLTEGVSFAADEAILRQGYVQIEFGGFNPAEVFCLISEVTCLVFDFNYFPQDDGFVMATRHNQLIGMK